MNTDGNRARWYFSFHNPYCRFAFEELSESFPERFRAIEWLPVWDLSDSGWGRGEGAGLPGGEMSAAKERYVRQDVNRIARKRGLTMSWPVEESESWEVPHLAYLVAERHGRGAEFAGAVYRARWEGGRDVCTLEEIGGVAEEFGLGSEVRRAVSDDAVLREQAGKVLERAERDGVFGTPFFVAGREKLWGAEWSRSFAAMLNEG
ncbi:2-hydroxychromene-2-carboxylate isomerase [Actinopolyspora alba]|uniref:2-hydroxychromene-2-carboxylate isomerase n=1 Tax=Actinopolyspora alba TaxID=673379 RepID=A0A1I1TPB9_9ACTN|nr:DsbA family protein [Actinopolyspora alba]SFD60472.1 2-hydroxychromene-2-carboxylate isomerase [Actinopolyspora alba]